VSSRACDASLTVIGERSSALPETSEDRGRPARLSHYTADETSISHRSGRAAAYRGSRLRNGGSTDIILAKNVKASGIFKLCWSRL
jgi:hypothetical protein